MAAALAFGGLLAVVGLAALMLYARDKIAASQGKSPAQVQAQFQALIAFYSALRRSIPGVLVIILGCFFVIDRITEHESDWWQGLIFIPIGWLLIPLFARKRWRRYLELRRLSEQGAEEQHPPESSPRPNA